MRLRLKLRPPRRRRDADDPVEPAVDPDEAPITTEEGSLSPADMRVPFGLQLAAGYAWRVLIVGLLLYIVVWILAYLSTVTIPLLVATLFTAMLWPGVEWLVRHRVPRALAVILGMLSVAIVVGGVFTLVGTQIVGQAAELQTQATASFTKLMRWLADGPLHLQREVLDGYLAKAQEWAKQSQGKIASIAASVGTGIGHFLAGAALALFATFFFLYEGRRFARGGQHLVPRRSRVPVLAAAHRGWEALVAYVRAAVVVAFVDGLGALIGAAAIGSNLFLAIGALTFITAFVPIVGAVFAGFVATAVVLVTLGWVKAVIMLAVFVAVMQLEGHILQPFLMGRAVSLHPLAVLFGIAVGSVVAGIVGALFVVPLMAFGNAFVRELARRTIHTDDPPAEPATPVPVSDSPADVPVPTEQPAEPLSQADQAAVTQG